LRKFYDPSAPPQVSFGVCFKISKKTKGENKMNDETTAAEKKEQNNTETIKRDNVLSYLKSFGMLNVLNDTEITQFVETATAFQLNPFKREIYCISYETKTGRRLSIITGYEVFLKRAERTGKLSGWNVIAKGEIGKNLTAIVTIYRKDWTQPFVHEVEFAEYNQGNPMWSNKPKTMLKKVAIAQGFRMAFPDEFAGMPHTADELSDDMTGIKAARAIPAQAKPIKEPEATSGEKTGKAETHEPPKKPEATSGEKTGKAETHEPPKKPAAPVTEETASCTGVLKSYFPPKGASRYFAYNLVEIPNIYLSSDSPAVQERMDYYLLEKKKVVIFYDKKENVKNGKTYINRYIKSVEEVKK